MTETGTPLNTWTVGRLLQWTTQWFSERQVEGGRLTAELLLARACGCKKIELYTRWDIEPNDAQKATFREFVRQAGEHAPIAYLLGEREFYALDFAVTPAVLIPRPETEALVQRVIELCRGEPLREWNVLDLGTGSGCVSISIAKYASNARVIGSDISAEALAVASVNMERHGVGDRVRLVQADGVALTDDIIPPEGFHVLATNPPYISERQWPTLPPNVRDHEPRIALVPPGEDGLGMYRRLANESPAVLADGGLLLAEIGYDQHAAVLHIFQDTGRWDYIKAHRNCNDPYDRVMEFRLRNI
ncbi:MAG: peptide chain release factor N(5)-glutamine methyltransferase [Phycisphaerales bacterium]|nr:peptide chain release factor N(5)-glutamine methyltransferase [Phycisphaerales bacterium]